MGEKRNAAKRGPQAGSNRKTTMPYATSEMAAVMDRVGRQIDDEALVQSLHFSPTALANVRRVMMSGGTVVADTTLALSGIDPELADKLQLDIRCYIDHPSVVSMATQRRVTRAEIALDHAMSLPNMKLILIGSAPMALARLLKLNERELLTDTVVLAMPTGFASVVQLKERLWESKIPCIVVRGKKGGTAAASAVLNALMDMSIAEQGLE